MYHVAICDDDKVFISYIKKFLIKQKVINNTNLKFLSSVQEKS